MDWTGGWVAPDQDVDGVMISYAFGDGNAPAADSGDLPVDQSAGPYARCAARGGAPARDPPYLGIRATSKVRCSIGGHSTSWMPAHHLGAI